MQTEKREGASEREREREGKKGKERERKRTQIDTYLARRLPSLVSVRARANS